MHWETCLPARLTLGDLEVGQEGLAHARLAEDGAIGNISHEKLHDNHQLLNLQPQLQIRPQHLGTTKSAFVEPSA